MRSDLSNLVERFEWCQDNPRRSAEIAEAGQHFAGSLRISTHPELESFREGNYVACQESWVARFPRIPWWNESVALADGWGAAGEKTRDV